MPEHGYVAGDPWAECDSCHFVVRRSSLRQRWDGFLVCVQRCWEPRPDAERPPRPRDREAVPNARPDPYAGQYYQGPLTEAGGDDDPILDANESPIMDALG